MTRNELVRWTVERVAREMSWPDLVGFERVDLPLPGLFTLFDKSRKRVVLVAYEQGSDIGVSAAEQIGDAMSHCRQLISSAALRAHGGDLGEVAKSEAAKRFRRLKDLDLAEDLRGGDALDRITRLEVQLADAERRAAEVRS